MRKKPIVALIYDFDGTLSPGNMQEFGFIQAIGKNPDEFWRMSDEIAKGQDASNILSYMKLMFDEARRRDIKLRREDFQRFGKDIELFDGVKEWFGLVNRYGREHGVTIEHYINSSGLAEIVEGTPIAHEFKRIFACSFLYNDAGEAVWPGVAVDYTAKTQFIFKINKMFGGNSIAVYNPANAGKRSTAGKLLRQGRVNFITPAVYTADSRTFKVVCAIIDRIKAEHNMKMLNLQE